MAQSFICITDNQSFPTLEALELHESGGHVTKGTPTVNQELNPEFAETLKRIQEAERDKKNQVPVEVKTDPALPLEMKPIRLTYKFTGNCKCGKEPSTLMIETPEGLYATAYCIAENIQLESIKVVKLDKSQGAIMEEKKQQQPKNVPSPKIHHPSPN